MSQRHFAITFCLCLLAPAAAGAQSPSPPPMAVWSSTYQRLDSMPGGADALLVLRTSGADDGAAGTVTGVQLPFGFSLLGSAPQTRFNVGSKGYIVFGSSGGGLYSPSFTTATDLLLDTAPRQMIAAWWGNHYCNPNGGVRTKVLGTTPHRRFVIEWSECSKMRSGAKEGTGTTFETQIWLHEGSNLVRVHYGDIAPDVAPKWPMLSWGIKGSYAGFLGPDRHGVVPICEPGGPKDGRPACGWEHFPAGSVIQYGSSPGADLAARVVHGPPTVLPTQVEVEVTTTLLNVGDEPASGVGYELYFAGWTVRGPEGLAPIVTRATGVDLAAGEALALEDRIAIPRPPNGSYRVCALVDPDGLLGESDRSNNWNCSNDRIAVGPDLAVLSLTPPSTGSPEAEVTVQASIRNLGGDPSGPFDYRLQIEAADASSTRRETIFEGTIVEGLAAGQSMALTITAELPRIIRAEAYRFVLELDPRAEIADALRSNNVLVSTGKMLTQRPQLQLSLPVPDVVLPDGCFYGEEISATFEVCNMGKAPATAFVPGVIMGDDFHASLTVDVTAASFPRFCGVPGTANHRPCESIGSLESSCILEYCRAECQSDAQCGPGLACAKDPYLSDFLGRPTNGCITSLAFGTVPRADRCQTYEMRGRIPLEDQHGIPYAEGERTFVFLDDVLHGSSQLEPSMAAGPAILCRPALLDLAASNIEPLGRFIAGKETPIHRRIDNLGFINPGPGGARPESVNFTYRYYLASTPDVSVHHIPLNLHGAYDGSGTARLGRKDSLVGTDRVVIPASLEPGVYYLGLIVDPDRLHLEQDEANNVFVHPMPIEVEPPGLTIVTDHLPRANVGMEYSFAFLAKGGLGRHVWSADNLPPPMVMTADGVLSGRPAEPGTFAFTVRVRADVSTHERVVALQILPGLGELEITSRSLPLAVKGRPYGLWFDDVAGIDRDGVQLAATGGRPPYRWRLDLDAEESRLPEGLEVLEPQGLIRGRPTVMSLSSRFLARVADSLGNENHAWLEIVVVDEGTLAIASRTFPLGDLGADYSGCIEARGGGGTYHWTSDEDTIPPGLRLEASGANACLRGFPAACGSFVVGLHVSDGRGQSATAAALLDIECSPIQLRSQDVQPVRRGEEVTVQLRTLPSDEPLFRLYRGSLPDGLVLREDGLISGTVAEDASYGTHDVILDLSDSKGRRSLAALGIRVEVDPRPRKTITEPIGCTSGGSGVSFWALALLASLALGGLSPARSRRASRGRSEGRRRDADARWDVPRGDGHPRPGR